MLETDSAKRQTDLLLNLATSAVEKFRTRADWASVRRLAASAAVLAESGAMGFVAERPGEAGCAIACGPAELVAEADGAVLTVQARADLAPLA